MKCIYCGKKLPMVKKLTSEEFCSVAHRQAYHDEQEQLALARLLEDQQRRKPVRKPLQKPREEEPTPEFADFLFEGIGPRTIGFQTWATKLEVAISPNHALPGVVGTLAIPRSGLADVEVSDPIPSPVGESSVEEAIALLSQSQALLPAADSGFAVGLPAVAHASSPAASEIPLEASVELMLSAERPVDPDFCPEPVSLAIAPAWPGSHLKPQQQLPLEALDLTPTAGSLLPFDLAQRFRPLQAPAPEPMTAVGPTLSSQTSFPSSVLIGEPAGLPGPEPNCSEVVEWLPSPPSSQPRPVASQAFIERTPYPVYPNPATVSTVLSDLPVGEPLQDLWEAGPSPAIAPDLPASHPAGTVSIEPIPDLAAYNSAIAPAEVVCYAGAIQRLFSRPSPVAPRSAELAPEGEIPQAAPRTLLMAQSRSARDVLARTLGKCEIYTELFQHPDNFLKTVSGNWAATNSLFAFTEPFLPKARIASVRRSTLSVVAKTFRSSRQTGISVHPDPALKQPVMREWVRPEKLAMFRPTCKLRILPARTANSALSALSPLGGASYRLSWQALQNRWHDAPNDLRWIALAVPLVIGLLWFAESPSAQHGAKGRITSMIPNVGGLMNTSFSGDSFEGLKQNIQRRAAVELSDDFRQGLGEWSGIGDWSRGWTYDPAGFIRPRHLALYTPSLTLSDYRFEFLGAIERKALSWVFRAADVKNYYVARLEVTRGGPLPKVELVRYAVINGRPGPKRSIPLPMQVRTDTIYRVRVDVQGSDFVTSVQGQVVDVFTDDRLARGGVGFFSESGEDARLRWVEVSHQYDMLGRLCAYLVPYNVSNSNVRSAP